MRIAETAQGIAVLACEAMEKEMETVKQALSRCGKAFAANEDGSVFVEYLLLLTIVGIGVIAGLATLRGALISELIDLANAIASISTPTP